MLARFRLLLGVLLVLLTGCTTSESKSTDLIVSFATPPIYRMVVEEVQLKYIDNSFKYVSSGLKGKGTYHLNDGRPWRMGGGASLVSRGDIPVQVTTTWFSMAEQKSYQAIVDIPENIREAMSTPYVAECSPKKDKRFANKLIIGMAPGGVMQLWYTGSCIGYQRISRADGKQVKPRSDYKLWIEEYIKEDAEYLKQPIPYGRW